MPVGERRLGHPRTEEERRARYKKLTGKSIPPPRGTGLKKRGGSYSLALKAGDSFVRRSNGR